MAAFGASDPLERMKQAAIANVLQFFAQGKGDVEQFYNLPGRAVFEPVTAGLAILGIAVLLLRFRQAPALFLLLWFPALLLPSFLATDRWPTLPRVLGVIPGVYFFPAVGLAAVVGGVWLLIGQLQRKQGSWLAGVVAGALVLGLIAVHGATAWRDYFKVWAPSQATFDAFEGDMTAAWRWLGAHPQSGHVYLSSDIYRHPTYMLLGEHASVQTIFTHRDPGLSWFDGRYALPLPPEGEGATYVFTLGAGPHDGVTGLLPKAQRPGGGAGRLACAVDRERGGGRGCDGRGGGGAGERGRGDCLHAAAHAAGRGAQEDGAKARRKCGCSGRRRGRTRGIGRRTGCSWRPRTGLGNWRRRSTRSGRRNGWQAGGS